MQTERDAQIVSWLGRVGAASAEQVMARFGMGRSWAYRRLSFLVADGLLEHRQLLHRTPGLYLASAQGLRWTGLRRLGVYRLSPGAVHHATELASAAVALHRALPGWRLLSERELRVDENDRGQPIASAVVGEHPGGRAAFHRPDLALISAGERVLAVEVELSVKAPRRLQAICRGYARARHVDHTYYLASRQPAGAVARAIAHTRAEDRITVLALQDTDGLAAAERTGTSRG
jgi:hypothetical protein